MIFSHFPISTLTAYLKNYNNLLKNGCKNSENVLQFKDQCVQELCRKYDLYKEK